MFSLTVESDWVDIDVGSVVLSTLLDVEGDDDDDELVMVLLLSTRGLLELVVDEDKNRCYGTVRSAS